MKLLVSILASPKFAKALEWGKLITITGSAQIVIQIIGFICGILIVRLLSTEEYAHYVLANTMLGTMVMLADSGISNGIMAEGGKVWQDKKQLGVVLATGLSLRRKFGFYSLIVTTPILAYLLLDHGASIFLTFLIILAIIPAFFSALSDSFLEMAPRLHQEIKDLQMNQLEVSLGRLALTGLFLLFLPFTFVALIANGIPRIYGNYKLRKISKRFASDTEKPDLLVKKKVRVAINRTMPIVIYHCFSGQISIWLISFFGSTSSISQLGALGRINMLFGLFGALFSTLVVPRFSRLKSIKGVLLTRFLLIQGVTLVISVSLVFFLWLFSDQVLWILGPSYYGLSFELLLLGISSGIILMMGVCSELIIIRGWYLKPYFLIGVNFTSTVMSLMFFNISSLVGVLYFNIIVTAIAYLLNFFYGIISINRINNEAV